ncbi:LysR family transcriptional regulator [Rubellimicrobium aerolatum]|uniref:LysR family transcriptional regulator n=1 Tax=Rubellimicrobium aerolatum TaxID=490979 RepID=A0ABW0SG56_9RHOB|nr:LysR family transcriptional regulator [Rubellimicrobium aerolatum]MBP1805835.1 DNA-binding transcriptional LysR family regulator [Rubellimicrobium aerolatum]
MTSWDEIRTAFQVARLGTVSAAAEALGVHHATVIRHVDALESRLGARLFQRHARGYTPTEAGRDLLRVAEEAEDRFAQLVGRIRDQSGGVSGELVVTSLAAFSPYLTPLLTEFQAAHPGLVVRYLADGRLFRLEYGEAHVAIRAGLAPPSQPDNVVQPLLRMRYALVAAPAYLDRHGTPATPEDLARHAYVGLDALDGRAPFNRWLAELAPRERVIYRVAEDASLIEAIAAGAGLGFVSTLDRRARPNLVEVLPPREGWEVPVWLVTHVDLHRTPKVQAVLSLLKERAKAWDA